MLLSEAKISLKAIIFLTFLPKWKCSHISVLVSGHWQFRYFFTWSWHFGCTTWQIPWEPHTTQPTETQQVFLKFVTQDCFPSCYIPPSGNHTSFPVSDVGLHGRKPEPTGSITLTSPRAWFGLTGDRILPLQNILWQIGCNLPGIYKSQYLMPPLTLSISREKP